MSLDSSKCYKCEKPKKIVYQVRARFTKADSDYNMLVYLCSSCIKEIEE